MVRARIEKRSLIHEKIGKFKFEISIWESSLSTKQDKNECLKYQYMSINLILLLETRACSHQRRNIFFFWIKPKYARRGVLRAY